MSVMDREQVTRRAGSADRLLADAASAAEASHARIDLAVAELFHAQEPRLDDGMRLAMARLLAGFVATIEDDLRQRLLHRLSDGAPETLLAAFGDADVSIAAPILERARLLHDAELVAALLRRAEEHRLRALLPPAGEPAPSLIDTLMQGPDELLGGLAMALLVAETRCLHELEDPVLARTDLPAELQHRLVWWVAAALRRHILSRRAMATATVDRILIAAATEALAGYDEGDTVEGRAMQVARRLQQRRALDDAFVLRAVGEGHAALAVAALAVRAGIEFASAWEMTTDRDGSRLFVLLRATGFGRSAARDIAALFACIDPEGGQEEGEDRIAAFDWLDPVAAREAIRPWQLDGGYRRALSELAAGLSGDRRR